MSGFKPDEMRELRDDAHQALRLVSKLESSLRNRFRYRSYLSECVTDLLLIVSAIDAHPEAFCPEWREGVDETWWQDSTQEAQ